MQLDIHEVAYHRNGIAGAGFHIVRFYDRDNDVEFVGVVFGYSPKPHRTDEDPEMFYDPIYRDPHVAVFDPQMATETVAFGYNSWRGDNYASDLYHAIDDYWTEKE